MSALATLVVSAVTRHCYYEHTEGHTHCLVNDNSLSSHVMHKQRLISCSKAFILFAIQSKYDQHKEHTSKEYALLLVALNKHTITYPNLHYHT